MHKKAFTLTELLVVVLVLGVLAGVAVPKMKQVLETRKTGEAEEILSAVRTEQEQRCVMGKDYLIDIDKSDFFSSAKRSKHYNYKLDYDGGASANSKEKDYTIRMFYKTGGFCCEGAGCAQLNKNYPNCEDMPKVQDECLPEVIDCPTITKQETTAACSNGTCGMKTRVASCNSSTGMWEYSDWDESACNTIPEYKEVACQSGGGYQAYSYECVNGVLKENVAGKCCEGSGDPISLSCGNNGTKTCTKSCDFATGKWVENCEKCSENNSSNSSIKCFSKISWVETEPALDPGLTGKTDNRTYGEWTKPASSSGLITQQCLAKTGKTNFAFHIDNLGTGVDCEEDKVYISYTYTCLDSGQYKHGAYCVTCTSVSDEKFCLNASDRIDYHEKYNSCSIDGPNPTEELRGDNTVSGDKTAQNPDRI